MTDSTLADDLETIARALGPLHEDAFNPIHGHSVFAIEAVVENDFTRDYLTANEHVTTHPHLRRTNYHADNIPHGDPHARKLYRRAASVITNASIALIPAIHPRRLQPPTPVDLKRMLARLAGQHRPSLEAIRNHHLAQLHELADELATWITTWTPPDNYAVCLNPHQRSRCQGHPVVANDLCRSCYDHQRYLDATRQERHAG